MIGGQVVDLEAEHTKPTVEMLEYIHRSKTAALITASLVSGGLYAGAKESEVEKLRAFGLGDWAGVSDCGRRARRDPDFRAAWARLPAKIPPQRRQRIRRCLELKSRSARQMRW